MESFLADLRQSFRSLTRSRLLTFSAVLSLAVAIGTGTAVFSLIKGVFLKPVPVEKPGELMSVFTLQGEGYLGVSHPLYEDYRELNRVFSGLVAYMPFPVRVQLGESVGSGVGEVVSGNYFDVLGVEAELGRTFSDDEDRQPGGHPVAVLTHSYWQQRFSGDREIVGKVVQINDYPFTVIGVTEASFTSLHVHGAPDLFVPRKMHDQVLSGASREWFNNSGAFLFLVVGRLAEGVSRQQASAAMEGLADSLWAKHDLEGDGLKAYLMPLSQAAIHPALRDQYLLMGTVVAAIAGLLLLIACSNIATMLVARSLTRRKELSIRTALGAGKGRLARQLLLEGTLLALAGAGLGLVLAIYLRNFLWGLRAPHVGAFLDVGIDGGVFAFAVAVAVATGLLVGLASVAQLRKLDLVSGLKQTEGLSPSKRGLWSPRGLLVGTQVVLSTIVLVQAVQFSRHLADLRGTELGFEAENLVLLDVEDGAQGDDPAQGRQLYDELIRGLEQVTGVRSVALGRGILLGGGTFEMGVQVPGWQGADGSDSLLVPCDPVSEAYFETLEIPLISGREFTRFDRDGTQRVAIVNETMVRTFWPDRDPLGQSFRIGDIEEDLQVVGVVPDLKYRRLTEAPRPYIYVPVDQLFSSEVTLYLRADGDPSSLMGPVRDAVGAVNPGLPTHSLRTMESVMDRALEGPRWGALLLNLLGLVAVLLAAYALFGIVAFAVRSRQREIGIRMALGARSSGVLRLFLVRNLLLVAVGVGVGIALSFPLAPWVDRLFASAHRPDPWTFVGAALLLLAVAFIATFFPARTATRYDPVKVLRVE